MNNEIIIDSNILLRHFLQDIFNQAEEATALINDIEKGEKTGYISILVINEIIWILQKYYQIDKKNYLPQILNLLQLNNIKILEIKKERLCNILEKMKKKKIDFTDMYLFEIANTRSIASFDQDFRKLK